MMHCGNSWCRMSLIVEVCCVQWYQMWQCEVVLDKTIDIGVGYQIYTRPLCNRRWCFNCSLARSGWAADQWSSPGSSKARRKDIECWVKTVISVWFLVQLGTSRVPLWYWNDGVSHTTHIHYQNSCNPPPFNASYVSDCHVQCTYNRTKNPVTTDSTCTPIWGYVQNWHIPHPVYCLCGIVSSPNCPYLSLMWHVDVLNCCCLL